MSHSLEMHSDVLVLHIDNLVLQLGMVNVIQNIILTSWYFGSYSIFSVNIKISFVV